MSNGLAKVEILNFKKLRLISIERSDEGVTVIGGDNAQGKSALLEAIRYLYGGKKMVSGDLIRDGAENGYITGLESDGTVTKVILGSGTKSITKPGKKSITSGVQQECDTKGHLLSYDPTVFFQKDSAFQTSTILQMHGISFEEIDQSYKSKYEERTIVNRDVLRTKNALAAFESTHIIPNVEPEEPKSSSQLIASRDALSAEMRIRNNRAEALNDLNKERTKLLARLKELDANIALQKDLPTEVTSLQENIEMIDEDIQSISTIAAQRNAWMQHGVMRDEYLTCENESQALTAELEGLKEHKTNMIQNVCWAVRGLGYDTEKNVITWKGRDISQASDGEQVVIGVALVMAIDKSESSLKVMLLQNASFLDSKNRDIIKKMANKHGWWILMEVPSKTDCDIVIEDGTVIPKEG